MLLLFKNGPKSFECTLLLLKGLERSQKCILLIVKRHFPSSSIDLLHRTIYYKQITATIRAESHYNLQLQSLLKDGGAG